MYQQSETNWFGQTIQTYKDKIYGTQGYLRVSLTTNSDDNKQFNPPRLNINVSNNHSKNMSLSGENALELAMALSQAIKTFKGEKVEIVKKFKADLQLVIELFQHEGADLAKFTLLSNSTDFTIIVIPLFPTFMFFGRIIKDFSNNYFNICENIFYKSIDSIQKEVILQLPNLIKGMSRQVEMPIDLELPDLNKDVVEKTEVSIKELDTFIGGSDMSKVNVPEIDSGKIEEKENKVTFTEVESKFVTNILKNDLSTLENTISGLSVSHNPIEGFRKRLVEDGDYDDKFQPLSGITEDDLKSLSYMSRFTFLIFQKNYIENGVLIPQGFSPLSFKAKDFTNDNIELAYDLLLFNGYFRVLRTKLESKIPNALENKSIVHLAYRCFLDSFTFSFIKNIKKDQLVSVILNRFRCYDSKGVFDKYNTSCTTFGVGVVSENEIRDFVAGLAEVILGNGGMPTIDELHRGAYESGSLRLPIQNDFNLEQITNEIIPLEVSIKLNGNKLTDELITKVKYKESVSDEIIEFFKKKHKPVKTKKIDEISNLQRFIKDNEIFKEQIPDSVRDEFNEYIAKLGNTDFEFKNVDFPYEQFGDDLVKVLYLWKPEQDDNLIKNVKYLRDIYGDSPHTRSSIFAKESSENEEVSADYSNFADLL
ncbi:MAG: hypothetical protein KGD64_08745 [Candidatus Heimdallarchaeota archaeon]|nr:hypothetical protein [Candidatus Heimdallarchaeota archaeon]